MKKPKDGGVARRDILKLTAGAILVPALPQAPARPLRFFTPEEFAMVDELGELIIPADDHSPGARAADVAAFLDQQLSEAEAAERGKWRESLRLLNQLSGEDRAIVTEVAGTTRDVLRETIQIEGIPLHIIDTAGLRETDDAVEKLGIARTWASTSRSGASRCSRGARH